MESFTTPENLLAAMRWRYAVKKFDPNRVIDSATWSALEEVLQLSPSSYGLQPWKFLVVRDPAIRARLLEYSWRQSQIVDCSHLVVFTVRRQMTVADVERHISRVAEVRGVPAEKLEGFKKMMVGDIVSGPRSDRSLEWASLQAYIALGNFMTSAAILGIDTCPMEGFEPAAYDEELGLEESGLTTAVLCCAGYRAEDCKGANQPKVRYSREELFEYR